MTPREQAAHDAWASAGEDRDERDERDERPEDERAEDEAAARDEETDTCHGEE